MRSFILFSLIFIVPAAAAQGCIETDPCSIPVAVDPDDGLYFGAPSETMYNVTAGDWFVFEITNLHDGERTVAVPALGLDMVVPGLAQTQWRAEQRFGPFLMDSPGSYDVIDDTAANPLLLQVLLNDVTDVEAGEPPVTTVDGDNRVEDAPGFSVVVLLGALGFLAFMRRE